VEAPAGAGPAGVDSEFSSSVVSNPTGTRGAKEDRIDEFKLSRSRASRARVPLPGDEDDCNGELPFSMWDGIAVGFDGGEPEPMMAGQKIQTQEEYCGLNRKLDIGYKKIRNAFMSAPE